MSNLDYPISLLQVEREKISNLLALTDYNKLQTEAQFDGVNKAIKILIAEKMKDEISERERKKIEKALR